jgi:AcrR family transcriptional regulator
MTNILDTGGRSELMVRKRLSRQEKKAETRARLLEAAESVFARRGFHAASVEEVAEEAGFSTGAVYSNFGGKEDLFLALWDSALEGALRVADETFGSEERPFEERLGPGGSRSRPQACSGRSPGEDERAGRGADRGVL